MSDPAALPERETGFDRVLAFTVPDRHVRGRIVRLGPVLDEVLKAHSYAPPIRNLLSEALLLTTLLGSLMKDSESQLTMQAQARDGIADLMVCDYRDRELRGYVHYDRDRLGEVGANPSLEGMFGEGYLAITYDMAVTGERYQGIVPLAGDSLSQACEGYFESSEQVPTLIRTAIRTEGERVTAGGMVIQHLPEGEEGGVRLETEAEAPDWEHVSIMAESARHEEMVDPDLGLEQLLWRLFHEEREVRVEPRMLLAKGCRCSRERYEEILARFPESEREEMRDAHGNIIVDCAFCSKAFSITT